MGRGPAERRNRMRESRTLAFRKKDCLHFTQTGWLCFNQTERAPAPSILGPCLRTRVFWLFIEGGKKWPKETKNIPREEERLGQQAQVHYFHSKQYVRANKSYFRTGGFYNFKTAAPYFEWASNTVYSITKQKKNKEVISCRTWNWAKIKRTFNLHRGQILKIIIVAMACSVAWLVIISVSCYCESVGFSTILKAHISTFPLISSFIQSPIRWTNHCAISFIILLRAQLQTW